MVISKEFNITPFKAYMGKVIPAKDTEWFLIENYSLKNLSIILDKYFYILEREYPDIPNYEQLFQLLSIFKTAIYRRAPKERSIIENIEVTERYVKDGNNVIKVNYYFE